MNYWQYIHATTIGGREFAPLVRWIGFKWLTPADAVEAWKQLRAILVQSGTLGTGKQTANTHVNGRTEENEMDLSQYKPSEGFVQVFGERPFRPEPGEALIDMRGRQLAYQQLIRDWDQVTPAEASAETQALLDEYNQGIGQALVFTSSQRPGLWCRFPGIPARRYDIYDITRGAVQAIIRAQAAHIVHVGSLPPEAVFPTPPGLFAMNEEKRAQEEEAAKLAAVE
jgi:hypothetical protein